MKEIRSGLVTDGLLRTSLILSLRGKLYQSSTHVLFSLAQINDGIADIPHLSSVNIGSLADYELTIVKATTRSFQTLLTTIAASAPTASLFFSNPKNSEAVGCCQQISGA